MSVNIRWDVVNSDEFKEKLVSAINQTLQKATESIGFLQNLQVTGLKFGENAPTIELLEILNPFDEFIRPTRSNSLKYGYHLASFFQENVFNGELGEEMEREDVQIVCSIKYKSDLEISIETELSLNDPSPSFISLPLRFSVTRVHLEGINPMDSDII